MSEPLFDPSIYDVAGAESLISSLTGLATGALQTAVGFALGVAASPALEPLATAIRQDAYHNLQNLALAPGTAAEVAAENYAKLGEMQTEASYSGIDQQRFQYLYDVTLTGPGMGELITMFNRGTITADQLAHGWRKAKLEPLWDTGLTDLVTSRIPVADLAYMVVRGLVDDAGLLPVAPPSSGDKVARYPVAALDTLKEAASWGWDEDRFRALVGRSGLSMAPVSAAQAYFRGIIGQDDFYLAIAEGDLRNEWRDAILEVSRQIPTNIEFIEGELRGYLTTAQRYAGTARHGTSQADSDLLFAIAGRPLNVHAITTGLARGGTYGGDYATVPEPYQDAIRRSAIRPEYADLAYANRYTIPSYFILRAILQDGGMTEAQFADYGKQLGWPPELADAAAKALAPASTKAAGKFATKAETTAWTTAQKSYIAQEATSADVQPIFTLLGVDATEAAQVISVWNEVRSLVRKQLSPTEVKKAIGQPGKDEAWALQQLLARGYSNDDASTFLAE